MADETATTETKTEEQNEKFIKCPCCGELTLQKPLDIKSAVLDEYMASIISGVPFQHTYTLHNSIDITVAVLSKADRADLFGALQLLDTLSHTVGEENPGTKTKIDELASVLQLYYSIREIRARRDGKVVSDFFPYDKMIAVCKGLVGWQSRIMSYAISKKDTDSLLDDVLKLVDVACSDKTLSSIPEVMLRAIVKTHMDLFNILMDTGFDENFWKGIELA